MALGAWLICGLFIDGWAHNHQKPETIFTPWHAVFYSGFLACGLFGAWMASRHGASPRTWRTSLPRGQGLVLFGLAVFLVGAAGDLIWHSVFGIEVDVAALLSPTHLLMFGAGLLIVTGPFRSAWADGGERAPNLRQFLPALLSLTLATAVVAFFFMYLSPFLLGSYGTWVSQHAAEVTTDPGAAQDFAEKFQHVGIASVVITNLMYLAPLLLVLRRWRPPFGTATILLTLVTALIGGVDGFERWEPLLASPIAGLAADILIRRFDPSPGRPWALRAVAAAVPLVLWLSFFALFHLAYGVGWELELWAGVTVMAAFSGFGLSLLVAPPALPPDLSPA